MKFEILNNKIIGTYSSYLEDEICIPSNVLIIGKTSFAHNNKFKKIIFSESVYKIEEGAFFDCEGLEEIIIPSNIVIIEDGAFAGCKNLKKVSIYNNKIDWGENCFNNCQNLKKLIIDNEEYRLFYFPQHIQFAMARIEREWNNIKLYKGKLTSRNFPSEGCMKHDEIFFCSITKKNNEYIWYDIIEDYAIKGAEYQASGLSFNRFFNKEFGPESEITANEFSMLTGCCYEGLKYWIYLGSKIKKKQIDRDEPLKISEVLFYTKKYFPSAEEYVLNALNGQAIPRKIPLFENGISRVTPLEFQKINN